MKHAIQIRNLKLGFDSKILMQSGNVDIPQGELIGLIGRNGVGKSTLFRCLLGNFPYEGSVLVDGEELRGLSPGKRAKKIAYIPQNHRPTFGYTVLDTALVRQHEMGAPVLTEIPREMKKSHKPSIRQ